MRKLLLTALVGLLCVAGLTAATIKPTPPPRLVIGPRCTSGLDSAFVPPWIVSLDHAKLSGTQQRPILAVTLKVTNNSSQARTLDTAGQFSYAQGSVIDPTFGNEYAYYLPAGTNICFTIAWTVPAGSAPVSCPFTGILNFASVPNGPTSQGFGIDWPCFP